MTRIDHTNHNHPATPAARAICRKAAAQVNVDREAKVDALLVSFDGVMYDYLSKACRRFCTGQHDSFARDDMGHGHTTTHHTCRRDCAYALVDAGVTFSQICYSFS